MSDKDIRNQMIKNAEEECEELEKGIVLADMQIELMSTYDTDLSTMAGIRIRLEQLSEEYEGAMKRLANLRHHGDLGDSAARRCIQKARQSMNQAKEAWKNKTDKALDNARDLDDGSDDEEFNMSEGGIII